MGSAGELNCKSSYEKGSQVSVPFPEEGSRTSSMQWWEGRAEKTSKAKNEELWTSAEDRVKAMKGWNADMRKTLLYHTFQGTEEPVGWEQPGSDSGGKQGGRQGQGTERRSRRGLPRLWSREGKWQESDLQNKPKQHWKKKVPHGIFFKPRRQRESAYSRTTKRWRKGRKKRLPAKLYNEWLKLSSMNSFHTSYSWTSSSGTASRSASQMTQVPDHLMICKEVTPDGCHLELAAGLTVPRCTSAADASYIYILLLQEGPQNLEHLSLSNTVPGLMKHITSSSSHESNHLTI